MKHVDGRGIHRFGLQPLVHDVDVATGGTPGRSAGGAHSGAACGAASRAAVSDQNDGAGRSPGSAAEPRCVTAAHCESVMGAEGAIWGSGRACSAARRARRLPGSAAEAAVNAETSGVASHHRH